MNVTDGIRIRDLHSYRDFDVYIKHRNIGLPEKKSIRETVPFMNGYYDFSALNGAPAWGEREIEYVFDVVGDSPQDAENNMERILDWLCNVQDEDIFDDTLTRKHWHGSYGTCKPGYDESGELVELSVTFVVHPFKIADEPTEYTMTTGTYTITNLGMVVAPYVISDATAAIQIGNYVSSIPANEKIQLEIDLARGENTVLVTGEGTVIFSYYEEVM